MWSAYSAIPSQHRSAQDRSSTAFRLVLPIQLGRWHMWRMRLLEVQLLAAINEGNQWSVALAAAQRMTPFYRVVYPKVSEVERCACAQQTRRPVLLRPCP